ncbi:hypothetical protein [Ekhidna sp.]|uniref:hypothetical protein n=1 Tax=Ekhidna sp. TaxID=2608089 RepID=UPI003BAD32F8
MNGVNNLIFYKPKIKNFGDHLNELLIQAFDLNSLKHPTLGIGSIVTNDFLNSVGLSNREIFTLGSGCRSTEKIKNISFADGSFVRGPLSSSVIDKGMPFISDGAYLIRQTDLFQSLVKTPKTYHTSIIPYFRTSAYIDWQKFEKETGVHVIDPQIPQGIEHTLYEIAKSENIIAEAMHGAIVADILRVPWIQLDFLAANFENKAVNTFKWTDWQKSIGLNDCQAIDCGAYQKVIGTSKNYRLKNGYLKVIKGLNSSKLNRSINAFLTKPSYYLSTDSRISQIDLELEKSIQILRNDKS